MASVLIVDDERAVRDLLSQILISAGHTVATVESAEAALDVIAADPPAVAVCDVHMPDADGLWLADRIRELAPSTAMVLATGDAAVPPRESLRKGIVAYVLKPFVLGEIVQAVADGVHWHQQQVAQVRPDRRALPEAE